MISRAFRLACLTAGLALLPMSAGAVTGQVVDGQSGKPIAGAWVTLGDKAVRSDPQGNFDVDGTGKTLRLRAVGYGRNDVALQPEAKTAGKVTLEPFQAHALYLSSYGVASKALRHSALDIASRTTLNSLVIDVKGDRGLLLHDSQVPLAQAVNAHKVKFTSDPKELVQSLKAQGLYLIARIVVFKDDIVANAHPDWSVKDGNGKMWHDREKLAWVDPFKEEMRHYVTDIAVEAAQLGFDEIQFDYIRFPDNRGVKFSKANTQEARVGAISALLTEARHKLTPYNVFLSADIFGYVCWNTDDTQIGQHIETVAPLVDYMSPMLYPSGFQFGIPGYRNPVNNPKEIVHLSLERAKQRTNLPGAAFRPWLQAFRDYAFGGKVFGAAEIKDQIDAANASQTTGWLLWNPRNAYTDAGLPKKGATAVAKKEAAPVTEPAKKDATPTAEPAKKDAAPAAAAKTETVPATEAKKETPPAPEAKKDPAPVTEGAKKDGDQATEAVKKDVPHGG